LGNFLEILALFESMGWFHGDHYDDEYLSVDEMLSRFMVDWLRLTIVPTA
jgi:hypothetical protein